MIKHSFHCTVKMYLLNSGKCCIKFVILFASVSETEKEVVNIIKQYGSFTFKIDPFYAINNVKF